ncbi:hypothetical protein quinque_015704 [Culex quinquefasciatus]
MAGAVVWSSALLCIPADWTAGQMHRMAGVLAGDQAGFCPGSNVVPDRPFCLTSSIMAGAVVWSSALLCIPADWTAGQMHRMAGVLAGDQAGFCPGSNVVPDRRGIHGGHTHTQVYTRNSSFKDAN